MINVEEIVADADLQAPEPFTILRSTGQFVAGGFQSTTTSIEATGPVQRATDKEIEMLPEADKVSAVMAFWWTQPIYVTSGKAPTQTTHSEVPAGTIDGANTVFTLSKAPPAGVCKLYWNGSLQAANGVDYVLSGQTLTLRYAPLVGAALCVTWPLTSYTAAKASDILEYGDEQYRVLAVKHYPGSGYWKALGTRISAM